MFKNTASTFYVFAFDATTNVPKTGDAANITAYVAIDAGATTVLGDTAAAEMDATNAPGYYKFDAAQAETNGDRLLVTAKSSTSNIKVIGAPAVIYTRPATGWLAPTTAGRTLDVSAGGEAGLDWANIGSPTTAQNLSATNIDVDQIVASVSGAVGSVTGAVGSVTGNVGGTINGLTAVALKDFFDTDSTTTYASAVAGSVVKEIADNAGGSALTEAGIAAAVWDLDATGHQTGGTFGQAIGDPGADTNTIFKATVTDATGVTVGTDTATLLTRMGTPSDLGGGASLAANLSDIEGQTDDIGVAGAGLTNINLPDQTMNITGDITGNLSGSVGSVSGLTASDVGAIKTQTDKFVFTVANQVNANIESVNAVAVNGTGAVGDEWGP